MGHIIGNSGIGRVERMLRIAVCARRLALKLNREEQCVGRETKRAQILRRQFARVLMMSRG